ncbi:DUF3995 domain-containing protein [Aestuariimicrobium kwangyangense]|uniref:DUF3995 domain-containing protein n=1 Tax=Aestuariimicrobium kwangyangense TaxID=396389 RepID=UPI0003B498FA
MSRNTRASKGAGLPGPSRWLVAATVLGGIHAGFSFYWAAGGTALAWSLGSDLVKSFHGREWLLAPIGAIKVIAAVAPMALALWGWPARRLTRSACWLGASVLIVWGGLNTVVANLVLAGAIEPQSGFDRPGMIGHAWLWDPLFLLWGAAVATGLFATRRRVSPDADENTTATAPTEELPTRSPRG